MNLRQHKRMLCSKMHYIIVNAGWQRYIDAVFERMDTPEDKAERQARADKFWSEIQEIMSKATPSTVEPELSMSMFASREDLEAAKVEQAKVEFVCVKVKDGSVVDTFDTREDALALVLKHARGKKAKLQVMNSLTSELVMFSEEEMA